MKKVILSISIYCFTLGLSAQDLSTKIPSDAAAVVTIKGERLTQLVSVNDFSNSKLGQMLGKELSQKTDGKITAIADAGFDLEKNFYYFLDVKEGVFTNCFLIPLKDSKGFESLLSEREKEKIVNENGLSYMQEEYDNMVTLWNNNTMVVIFAADQSDSNDYYDDYGYYDDLQIESAVTEEMIEGAVEEETEEESNYGITIEEVEIEEGPADAKDAVEEAEEVVEEIVIESTESYNDYYNSEEYQRSQAEQEAKRKAREAQREAKRKELALATLQKAKTVMAGNYPQGSIMKNESYLNSVGNGKEEASAWVADFGGIYKDAAYGSYLFGAANPYSFMDIDKLYGGMSIAAKLDFEEDHAAIKTVYTMNDEMVDLYKQMYDGKLNSKFTDFINEDRMLGYWSVNMSVEGMLNAYPDLMDSMFSGKESNTYGDAVSLGTYLFRILIDEEAAAEIIRGDMLLVLNDLSERTVTYIDYEYDEAYNTVEVEKTKTETVPDFMFMFSSEQKGLFDRLVRIGVREGELEAINGMYKIATMGSSSPFDIYVMFKDGICFMGSSKRDMMAINTGSFASKLSGDHKKNMKKNVSSMYVNGKKIIAQIPVDSYPSELRDRIGFLTQNTEDVQFRFEKIKGNTMKGEMIWNTATSGHENSFDYFLNMIEAFID
ncbi:DUF4836 family protein [Aggregatimonas sangjinii]|uniref:DUF4836 family protein n=1 Tax=Aggregatimonas sangjinii TaxID=2583587 RepID=A0A5B7STS1_9FLAO|nr:DUF4836 family protein [Aggregatimonas sangjinii]QCX02006.1 DUF4836 family protein [Aggregatimonas sangjinii]